MSKSKKAKENFVVLCEEFFGSADRWGNYKIDRDGQNFRIKMNKTSWRYEVKLFDTWKKLGGAYYTDSLSEGKIRRVAEVNGIKI